MSPDDLNIICVCFLFLSTFSLKFLLGIFAIVHLYVCTFLLLSDERLCLTSSNSLTKCRSLFHCS